MENEQLLELKICNNSCTKKNICETNYSQTLLNAVLKNKKNEIDSIIKQSTKDILNVKYKDHNHKPIIIIACINEQVTKDTLNTLCQCIRSHYYNIDCFDENWYKWEPLHHVARMGDPEKLQILLDNSVEVNALTTFSENALHILLNYEQCMKPFNTFLYNGTESKECVIINKEKPNAIECAGKLIKAGINVNHSNLWNETPICIAARYRYIEIVKLLLSTPTIDLDNYTEDGLTIREFLKENYIGQNTLSQSNALYEDPIKILFDYLKSGNEDAFLQFNNENIKDYANSIDGNCEFNSSGNMLQFCFKKGYLEYLQDELYDEELTKASITDNLMIKVFYSRGLGRCILHLLNNGANPKLTYRKFPEPLLEAAAVVGYYPLVAILLQHKDSKITANEIFDILPKLYENDSSYLKNHEIYRRYVLNLLLNKLLNLKEDQVLTSKKLWILNNILHKLNLERDEERGDDSENICQILKLGASLTKRVKEKKMIIESIHLDTLKLHFDDCVDNNLFYYNSIIEDDSSYSETRALYFLANNKEKKELLRHPLLVHYIHNKWLRNFYFFYIDLFLYFIFLLSIYSYMVLSQRKSYNTVLNVTFYSLLVVHSAKEFIQLIFLYRKKYFSDISNYFELTVICCCLASIFYYNEYTAVIAILFSTVIFVMLLGQVPACAKYTIIFGSTKYFLQYAGFYFIQFVSFALVFYIIFPFKDDVTKSKSNSTSESSLEELKYVLGDILKSLFYTLVHFTGEFSDRVLEPDGFPVFGRFIMVVFIFCMTIILNNLLLGLIVADMDEMQRTGKLVKQITLANFIARMNSIVKRLYEFKTNNAIKYVINFLNIFKKGKNKIIDVNKCKHSDVFDDENLKYLKSIRYKRNTAYNKDLLRTLYITIQEKQFDNRKDKKIRKKFISN